MAKFTTGDIINDLKVIREFRDSKYNKRMLECRCLKCGRKHTGFETNFAKYEGSSIHGIVCSKGIAAMDKSFADRFNHLKMKNTGHPLEYQYLVDFYDDMYTKYLAAKQEYPGENIYLDRIDHSIGYIKGNLYWTNSSGVVRSTGSVYEFIAISPTGQYYLSNNQSTFAVNHGLDAKHISSCLRGLQETTNGWRFFKPNQPNELFWFNYEQDPAIIKELYY